MFSQLIVDKVENESIYYPSSIVSVPSRSVNCSVCSSHCKTMILINYHHIKSIFKPLETFSVTNNKAKSRSRSVKKGSGSERKAVAEIEASLIRKRGSVWKNDYRVKRPSDKDHYDKNYYRKPEGILERLRSIDFGEKRLLAVQYDSFPDEIYLLVCKDCKEKISQALSFLT